MQPEEFKALMSEVTAAIAHRPLDHALQQHLNAHIPAAGPLFQRILSACHAGVSAGWMWNREAGGVKFGRVVRPGPQTHGFSVDVVDMDNVAGPHHAHPAGEIDLVMPLSPAARFDGVGAGWLVYGPDSVHVPTVSGGRALVLYLLPEGRIDFTQGSSDAAARPGHGRKP